MEKHKRRGAIIAFAVLLACGFGSTQPAAADSLPTEKQCKKLDNPDAALKGWCVSINRTKGNCLACHTMVVNAWPEGLPTGGTIAPPLVAMKQRFPDRAKLRAQIWDALQTNPNSVMPPYGRHKIISEDDIDNIVEFLNTI